jgi:hypothetical protein
MHESRRRWSHIHADWKDFADEIIEDMENASHSFSGKEAQVRFSPQSLWVALALYLCNPKGYEELTDASFWVYPSVWQLKDF